MICDYSGSRVRKFVFASRRCLDFQLQTKNPLASWSYQEYLLDSYAFFFFFYSVFQESFL